MRILVVLLLMLLSGCGVTMESVTEDYAREVKGIADDTTDIYKDGANEVIDAIEKAIEQADIIEEQMNGSGSLVQ